jgi:YARHG domain-containing protein/uncharacterized protein DUF4424
MSNGGSERKLVDKGSPDNVVSFSGHGVRQISPTQFEVRVSQFTPASDLSVLILSPAQPEPVDIQNVPVDSHAQTNVAALNCDQLWQQRNSIFKGAGYCFHTPRGIRSFGNAGCAYDSEHDLPPIRSKSAGHPYDSASGEDEALFAITSKCLAKNGSGAVRSHSSILNTLMVATAFALVTVPAFADSVCFARHYDAAHLGQHPDQLVTSMRNFIVILPPHMIAGGPTGKKSKSLTAVWLFGVLLGFSSSALGYLAWQVRQS